MTLKKLNVGCGRNILPGWENLDSYPLPGVNIVADLDACGQTPLPLADASVDTLKGVLIAAGSRFASHDPTTWGEQAKLAAAGDWDGFKKLTDELVAGKRK